MSLRWHIGFAGGDRSAVGTRDVERAIGVEVELPVEFVDEVMVPRTGRDVIRWWRRLNKPECPA